MVSLPPDHPSTAWLYEHHREYTSPTWRFHTRHAACVAQTLVQVMIRALGLKKRLVPWSCDPTVHVLLAYILHSRGGKRKTPSRRGDA